MEIRRPKGPRTAIFNSKGNEVGGPSFSTLWAPVARTTCSCQVREHLSGSVHKQGGTRSVKLLDVALGALAWAENNFPSISAVHLRGDLNFVADFLSRMQVEPLEWELNTQVFYPVDRLMGDSLGGSLLLPSCLRSTMGFPSGVRFSYLSVIASSAPQN